MDWRGMAKKVGFWNGRAKLRMEFDPGVWWVAAIPGRFRVTGMNHPNTPAIDPLLAQITLGF